MRRTWIAVLAVVALAVTAAGCGGSDNSSDTNPTDAWASGFCSAVTDWKSSLTDIGSQLKDPSNLSQHGLQSAADDARSATDTFVSDLKDLGAPDTESGQEVKTAIDSLSQTVDTESTSIEDTAKGVSSIADVPTAIATISTSLSALGTALAQTLNTLDNADAKGELKTALDDSPDCAGITQ